MIQYTLSDILTILVQGQRKLFHRFHFSLIAIIHKPKRVGSYYYAELLEYQENRPSEIKASCKAAIFDHKVIEKFNHSTGLEREDLQGYACLLQGRFGFHAQYGTSIVIQHISETYAQGQGSIAYKKIRKKLQEENLRDQNRMHPAPQPPFRLAIISGEKSQGYKDCVSILQESPYDISYEHFACPVHGAQAAYYIHNTLQTIHREHDINPFTHVIITRGGGESAGMMRQNDYQLAKSICLSPLPIIVAIGHTSDTSLLDDIARAHAKTPSDAAYILIQAYDHIRQNIQTQHQMIHHNTLRLYEHYLSQLSAWNQKIHLQTQAHIEQYKHRIDSLYKSILDIHPLKLTQQGYGIVRKENGEYLGKDAMPRVGENIEIALYSKKISAHVQNIEKHSWDTRDIEEKNTIANKDMIDTKEVKG